MWVLFIQEPMTNFSRHYLKGTVKLFLSQTWTLLSFKMTDWQACHWMGLSKSHTQQREMQLHMQDTQSRCIWINNRLMIMWIKTTFTPLSFTVLSFLSSNLISIPSFLLSVLTFLLIFHSFTTRGSKRRPDWQACALSPLDNTPPTSPVAWVTDGFSLPKHSVSISVTSDWWVERERGGVCETQSILHVPWQMTVLQTNSVQWVFVYVSDCDSVS